MRYASVVWSPMILIKCIAVLGGAIFIAWVAALIESWRFDRDMKRAWEAYERKQRR